MPHGERAGVCITRCNPALSVNGGAILKSHGSFFPAAYRFCCVTNVTRLWTRFPNRSLILVDGKNTFRAIAFSSDGTESKPYEVVVTLTAPAQDVSLHVVAVGINEYRNPALNLNYAEPDAKGIAEFFRRAGE